MTLLEARRLAATSIDARDADVLLAHILGRDRAFVLAHATDSLAPAQLASFHAATARRAAGEPLQYITGAQEFYGLALAVSPDVLIPRPETELLVEQVLLWATTLRSQRMLRIADVGTGSGAIAVALATHLAAARILATDISAAALAVATANAATHGCATRIRFLHADLLGDAQPGSLDAVVSNPPYIPAGDASTLQSEVVQHEPHTALFAGADGLDIYRRLIPAAYRVLSRGSLLALEIGFGQRLAVTALLEGWRDVHATDDYAGIPRIITARRA